MGIRITNPSEVLNLRRALAKNGFKRESESMREETVVALALVGHHPESLRQAALVIMPQAARSELDALKAIECRDQRGISRVPTDRGRKMMEVLASVAPERSTGEPKQNEETPAAQLEIDVVTF